MKVIHSKCQFTYILKTDDDCFVNTFNLVANFNKLTTQDSLYIGRNWVQLPERNENNSENKKWYLSKEAFPFEYLPPFNLGEGYVLSVSAVKVLLDTYEYIPYTYLELLGKKWRPCLSRWRDV